MFSLHLSLQLLLWLKSFEKYHSFNIWDLQSIIFLKKLETSDLFNTSPLFCLGLVNVINVLEAAERSIAKATDASHIVSASRRMWILVRKRSESTSGRGAEINKQLEKHRTCLQTLIEKYFKDMLKASPIHAQNIPK